MGRNSPNLEFRKIPSLDFLYEISEDGRIFRNVKSKKQLKIVLDTHHSKDGYYVVFVNIRNKRRRVMIHTAVAECWLGKRPNGLEIDHIDRNTHNNHFTNLRYVNHSEQMKNRVLSQRIIEQGTKNCIAYTMKYVAKPVTVIKDGKKTHYASMIQCSKDLGTYYGVDPEHIRSKLKKRRKRIYDFDIVYSECRDQTCQP